MKKRNFPLRCHLRHNTLLPAREDIQSQCGGQRRIGVAPYLTGPALEEEGIYYFFKHTRSGHKMIIADTSLAHCDVPGLVKARYDVTEGGTLNAGCYRLIDLGGYTGSSLEQSAMGDLPVEQ